VALTEAAVMLVRLPGKPYAAPSCKVPATEDAMIASCNDRAAQREDRNSRWALPTNCMISRHVCRIQNVLPAVERTQGRDDWEVNLGMIPVVGE